MKQSIDFNQFYDAFTDHNRLDNFSYEGLKALYEWIEDLDDSCGTETELDVIALCCEFTEYDNALNAANECSSFDATPEDDEEDNEVEALEYLQDHTRVITFDSGIIIQDF